MTLPQHCLSTSPQLLNLCFGNVFAMPEVPLELRWHCPHSLPAALTSLIESFGRGFTQCTPSSQTGMCRANVVTEDLDKMGVKRKRGGSQGVTPQQQ